MVKCLMLGRLEYNNTPCAEHPKELNNFPSTMIIEFLRPLIAVYYTDTNNHFQLLFCRSVRCRKDDHLICA